ncbi:MAG: hypothetical protein SGILL_002861 [Bacillariaceae sp.]
MKFFKAAVAAVAALASLGEAKISGDKMQWKKELNHRMKNNLYNKDVLMAGAKPHNDAAMNFEAKRNLGDFEITADYSIQFISCFSLTTSYDELFEENQDDGGGMGLMLMSQGNAVAERSYAIFKLCYTSHCDYTGSDPSLEYTIDLSVYVQALVMYLPEQVEGFCEGCQENQDACYAQLYGGYGYAGAYGYNGQAYANNNGYQQANDGQNQNANANNVYYNNANGQQYQQANAQQMSNNNGNRRNLADIHNQETRRTEQGQVVRQLDCNLCLQYNCIEPVNQGENGNWNQDVYGFEAAAEWLTMISQCYQTGAVYSANGAYYQQGGDQGNMYAGFICNDEGNGVEIGMFLDEMCVLYLPNEPFSNYMNLYDSTYQQMTRDIIEFTFSDATFDCKDEEVVYTTQNVDGYNQYANYNWDANDDGDAAEWCQYLSNNDLGVYPVSMYDCGGNAYGNYYNKYGQNDDNQYKYMYSWYQFEINEENALDMGEVCLVVKQSNGQLHTFYNGDNGHQYNYGSSSGSSSGQIEEFLDGSETSSVTGYQKQGRDLSGAAKFGIIAAVGVVVGAIVAVAIKVRSGATDKKEPLMAADLEGEQEGQMA